MESENITPFCENDHFEEFMEENYVERSNIYYQLKNNNAVNITTELISILVGTIIEILSL